jgi:hypothetical protein
MNNPQNLSQDIIYNLDFSNDFSNDFSINDSNNITDILINEKFISEENINESNNTNIVLPEWYEDKWYITITGIFLSVIILISIYIFIQYF